MAVEALNTATHFKTRGAVPSEHSAAGACVAMRQVALEEWDGIAANFDGAVQEQLHSFAAHRWPSVVCEPWVFEDAAGIIGGALVMIQNLPLRLGAIAVSKWAPIFKDHGRADARALYSAVVNALVAEYADKRGMMVSILPRAVPRPENMEYAVLLERGFKAGPGLPYPGRYFVSVAKDDETLMASFAQKWRYHLRKSMKAGLSFEEAGPERAGEFDALYQAMTDRKQFADHSAYEDTFTALMTMENEVLRPKLFFVRHEGVVVAGAVIFTAGDTAVYLYGATNDDALPLRAGYFLHWHVLRWLRLNSAAKWYDLGGTDGFQGLHQFKKGMVGSDGEIQPVPPVLNYASHWRAKVTGWLAFTAREMASRMIRQILWLRSAATRPDQER